MFGDFNALWHLLPEDEDENEYRNCGICVFGLDVEHEDGEVDIFCHKDGTVHSPSETCDECITIFDDWDNGFHHSR